MKMLKSKEDAPNARLLRKVEQQEYLQKDL